MRLRHTATAAAVLACTLLAAWLWTPDEDRATLEKRYVAAPGDMVNVVGWRLHLRDIGPRDAPAVILIHGFGASLQTWDAWAAGLAATHRVVRFDLPGSGLSLPDPAHDYTDARSVALVLAVMDSLGLQRASIVGHSIGGRIAWTFAATQPQRVDRLVLVAPDGFASPGSGYGQAPDVPWVVGLLRYSLPKAVLRQGLLQAYADPASVTDALVQRSADLLRAPGARQALLDRLHQRVLVDPRPLLAAIHVPTLLVWGERDAMIPSSNAADYLQALPQARLASFPGAGHVVQEEAAAPSLAAVTTFLAL